MLYTVVQSGEQLLVVRFMHGFSDGFLIPAAFTFLSKQTNAKRQGKAMALSGAAVGTAAIVGPAFSGIMKATKRNRMGFHYYFYFNGSWYNRISILLTK